MVGDGVKKLPASSAKNEHRRRGNGAYVPCCGRWRNGAMLSMMLLQIGRTNRTSGEMRDIDYLSIKCSSSRRRNNDKPISLSAAASTVGLAGMSVSVEM